MMNLQILPRKGVLAITAVIDIALHCEKHPVSSKHIAMRHDFPARYLEAVLQALTREGILRSIRGPRGGYLIGRLRVTAEEILQIAKSVDDGIEEVNGSPLIAQVVGALVNAEVAFSVALARITVEDLLETAREAA